MADVSVAILGLGRVGTSIGLALKRYNGQEREHNFTIAGYDTSASNVNTAKKLGAVDSADNRPEAIARGKDIVVVAMPYGETTPVYELIADTLRPGAVVMDLAPLKQKSLNWANKNLSKGVHLMGATPIVNPQYLYEGLDDAQRATADYFDGGVMLLMPQVSAAKEAISLASDFAGILGAEPLFYDPDEHDALVPATEILPMLLGTVYFNSLSKGSGWSDLQRLGNPRMAMVTHALFDTHPDDIRDLWMDSDDQLLRYLDQMIATMRELRQVLAEKDRDAVETLIEDSSREYEAWINRRVNNRWAFDEQLDSDSPTFGGLMGNMFGGFVANRLNRGKDQDKK